MSNILLIIKTPLIALFGTVLVMGAIINDSIDSKMFSNTLDVGVSSVKVDGKDITETAVNKNIITFTTGDLQRKGDTSLLEYELTNKSVYDVETSIKCVKNGKKSDYYTIDAETSEFISANATEKGSIKVTLLKESLTDSSEEFYCTLDVVAVNGK